MHPGLDNGRTVELAVRRGPAVSSGWKVGALQGESRELWAKLIQDLVDIQMHSHVVVPVPHRLTPALATEIDRAARLLRGEELPCESNCLGFTDLPGVSLSTEPVDVRLQAPIILDIDGQVVPTNQVEMVSSPQAHFELAAEDNESDYVAYLVFDTPATARATHASVVDNAS